MKHYLTPRGARVGGLIALLLALAGCSLAPVYTRPDAAAPAAFKEAAPQAADWKPAQPSEQLARGQWWRVFDDAALDALEAQALDANQNLKAAAARLQQARAIQQGARAGLFPTIGAEAGATRGRASHPSQGQADGAAPLPVQNTYSAGLNFAYEVDLFGRVADSVKAAGAEAQQSAALLRSVQLALQADVAQNYFTLRQLDAELDLYRRAVALREAGLKLVRRRYSEGQISELDVARADAELAAAQSEAMTVQRLRAASEHGLAVLLGQAPASFSLAPQPLRAVDIHIAPGLPSSLLERRPDIAAAERAMAAANARIGVARAAWFPALSLTGSGGVASGAAGNLFNWSSRTFLLGPLAALPLFDGGRRDGQLVGARAQYEEDVANYRQRVLMAFQEVEDQLSTLRILQDQAQTQERAVQAAGRAARLSRSQYAEGAVNYLDVIDAERTVLQAQRAALQLAGAQAVSTVNLIRALGGGWEQGGEAAPAPSPPAQR
jgi:multidrug efflux system outer membrane protein